MQYDEWMKKTGGQAFKSDHWNGLTIRDYFAAMAMQGSISRYECVFSAEWAYDIADKMIAERDK